MGREAWQATVHGIRKSQTRLSDLAHTFLFYIYLRSVSCACFRSWLLCGEWKRSLEEKVDSVMLAMR